MTDCIWTPTNQRAAKSQTRQFGEFYGRVLGHPLGNSDDLALAALENPEVFWNTIWDYFGIIGVKGDGPYVTGDSMLSARFFPNASLNYAENLLELGGRSNDGATALVFRGEDKVHLRWTWGDLRAHVSRLQQALKNAGLEPGDRVAGVLPNHPEAVAAMLATVSLGGVWCSASPDFGARAVLDRFSQIEPKILFVTDGYFYAGKRIDLTLKIGAIVAQLPSVSRTIVIEYIGIAGEVADSLHNGTTLAAFEASVAARDISFKRLAFDHPLFILFSSGTTGAPKCILHRAGGVLLQHLKEHALHADVQAGDGLFYFTTLGWMMWNWLVSGLACGATLHLYDGSPFHPKPDVLFDFASDEQMTHFGTSAKYLDSLRKVDFKLKKRHNLSALRTLMSTGSPLVAENFDYIYSTIKQDIHLTSISGGTDIVSCFIAGDPTMPVHRAEMQRAGFGLAVEVWRDDGTTAPVSEKGELVCTSPFPSMPLGFWDDATGERYEKAYFSRFPGVWCQGDFAERCESGGWIIHGRSDATLNPGGVRIGTAEIYAEVEKFSEIRESVVIGQEIGSDVRVVLFVSMSPNVKFNDALIEQIKIAIRTGSSPRHVPALVLAVSDIPRTKSGKVTELAVRDVVHGRDVVHTDSLENPEALDCFRNLPELVIGN